MKIRNQALSQRVLLGAVILALLAGACGKIAQKNPDPSVVTGTEAEALTEIQSRLKKEDEVRKILKQTREVIQNLSTTVDRFAKAIDLLAPEAVSREESSAGFSGEIRKRLKAWIDVLSRSIEAPGKSSYAGSRNEWSFSFQLSDALSSLCNTAQLQVVQISSERNYLINLKHCALPDYFEIASATVVPSSDELQLRIYPEAIEKFLRVATDFDGVQAWLRRDYKPLDPCDLNVKGNLSTLKCEQLQFSSARARFVFETLEMVSSEQGLKLITHAKLMNKSADEILATASLEYEQGKSLDALICDSKKHCNQWPERK